MVILGPLVYNRFLDWNNSIHAHSILDNTAFKIVEEIYHLCIYVPKLINWSTSSMKSEDTMSNAISNSTRRTSYLTFQTSSECIIWYKTFWIRTTIHEDASLYDTFNNEICLQFKSLLTWSGKICNDTWPLRLRHIALCVGVVYRF